MFRRSVGRFQKMDNGIQRRRYEDRHILASGFQEDTEEKSAEECFLDNGDKGCCGRHSCHCGPIDCAAHRKDWRRQQDRAAAEQGNCRKDETCYQIASPTRIWRKLQITHATDLERPNERPKQNDGGNEQRPVEKSFEIVSREKR